ncbi:MAG: hypothetical protein WA888_20430 [Burkholderiaceae bacterium]
MYTEHVLWSPAVGPGQTTEPGVEGAIGGLFEKPSLAVEIEADEGSISGDSGWATGIVNGISTDKVTGEKGKFRFRLLQLLAKQANE